jgi:hypothetical protein
MTVTEKERVREYIGTQTLTRRKRGETSTLQCGQLQHIQYRLRFRESRQVIRLVLLLRFEYYSLSPGIGLEGDVVRLGREAPVGR